MADGIFSKLAGGVNSLFGGQFDPRLSVGENAAATKEALVTGGLATIAAGAGADPRGFSPTGLQRIAGGALAGREAGELSRAAAVKQNQQDNLQRMVDSGEVGPDLIQDMFLQAVADDNVDAMRALSAVLPSALTSARGSKTANRIIEMDGTDGPGKYAVDTTG